MTTPGALIATVCARGGSKGLPRKNVLPFAGLPLIAHSIRQALACPLIEGVYVSTDDEEIAQVARDHGARVPYLRPAELATDTAGKLPAIEHLVAHLEAGGAKIATIVDHPKIPKSMAMPGDLIFTGSPIHHVGIYLGGGTMVHAPQYGDVVKVSPIRWWKVVGVVRPG